MADFLLELLSEEIPARMQEKASADLQRLFEAEIAKAGLAAEAIETYATPRRLALIARGLPGAGSWPLLPPELVLTGAAPVPPAASRGGRGRRASRGGRRWRLRLAAARRGSSAAAAVREMRGDAPVNPARAGASSPY